MELLSYRGPSDSSSISAAMSRVLHRYGNAEDRWWFLSNMGLAYKTRNERAKYFCRISSSIVDGHYRYCNNFIWPLMHEFPKYANYNEHDKKHFEHLNMAFAHNVIRAVSPDSAQEFFAQDYQLALTPQIFGANRGAQASLFWHIPWMKELPNEHIGVISDLAAGMLCSEKLGFQTEEYALNFLQFIKKNLPQYDVDFEKMLVTLNQNTALKTVPLKQQVNCKIIVQALGFDVEFWEQSNLQSDYLSAGIELSNSTSVPYFLSVDRSDYTKGILERIKAIDLYFENNPDERGKLSFIQVCQPSRIGLDAFDQYWNRCLFEVKQVNTRWGNNDWHPIIWIQKPLIAIEFCYLYKNAMGMIVSPIRDGLNLIPKEYISCNIDGSLILSPGAGIWQQLKEHVITVEPNQAEGFAEQIELALNLSRNERARRMEAMKSILKSNDLSLWWQTLTNKKNCSDRFAPNRQMRVEFGTDEKALM